jgi:hypothetical protein
MVPSGFAAFTRANRTKSSVSPWRAVRPAILGDRLTRREAGPQAGKGGAQARRRLHRLFRGAR